MPGHRLRKLHPVAMAGLARQMEQLMPADRTPSKLLDVEAILDAIKSLNVADRQILFKRIERLSVHESETGFVIWTKAAFDIREQVDAEFFGEDLPALMAREEDLRQML